MALALVAGRWFCHEPNLPGFLHIPSSASASAPSGKHSSLSAVLSLAWSCCYCYCHCHQTSHGSQKKRQKASPVRLSRLFPPTCLSSPGRYLCRYGSMALYQPRCPLVGTTTQNDEQDATAGAPGRAPGQLLGPLRLSARPIPTGRRHLVLVLA